MNFLDYFSTMETEMNLVQMLIIMSKMTVRCPVAYLCLAFRLQRFLVENRAIFISKAVVLAYTFILNVWHKPKATAIT